MLEISMNYIESLDPLFELCKDSIMAIVERLRSSRTGKELLNSVGQADTTQSTADQLISRWNLLCKPDWPRVTHSEGVRILQEAESSGVTSFEQRPGPEIDFDTEHEIFLTEHFQRPVFMTHYPTTIRLFSALQSPPPEKSGQVQTTESIDLLLSTIGEAFSGGLREHRLEKLVEVMRSKYFFHESEAGEKGISNGNYPYLRDDEV